MRRQSRKQMFLALGAIVACSLMQLATPFAISAQGRATMRVTVNVVSADAAWAGENLNQELVQDLSRALAAEQAFMESQTGRTADGMDLTAPRPVTGPMAAEATEETTDLTPAFDFRRESGGTVVWLERPDTRHATVHVAHLAT